MTKPLQVKLPSIEKLVYALFAIQLLVFPYLFAANYATDNISFEIFIPILTLMSIILILKIINGAKIKINASSIALAAFLFYYYLRAHIDYNDVDDVIGAFLSSTSGIVLYLFLGIFYSAASDSMSKNSRHKKVLLTLLLGVLYVVLLCNYYTVISLVEFVNLMNGWVLLEMQVPDHQRVSSLLLISFLVIVRLELWLRDECWELMGAGQLYLRNVLIAALFLAIALVSQLIGSNKGLMYSGAIYIIFALSTSFSGAKFKSLTGLFVMGIESQKKFLMHIITILILVCACIITMRTVFDIGPNMFRVLGGDEMPYGNSITGRMEIWADFYNQLNHNTILGDLNKHLYFGGTYVHSFLGQSLTHLGLIATTLLVICLAGIMRGSIRKFYLVSKYRMTVSTLCLFDIYIFTVCIFLSSLTESLNSIVVWFLIGAQLRFLVHVTRPH